MIQQMAHLMEGFFPVLFRMSLTAGITVLLVLAVRALFQKMSIPKIFSYALWGIVLFRLLCPVSFSTPFSVLTLVPKLSQESKKTLPISGNADYVLSRPGYADTKKTLPDTSSNTDHVLSGPIHADTTAPVDFFEIQVALGSGENNTDRRTPFVSSDNNAENDFHISVETIGTGAALPDKDITEGNTQTGIFTALTVLWLTGLAVVLTVNLRSYHKLKKKAACSVRLSGNIYLADKIGTPCCLGLCFPKIYLPSTLSDKEREYVILHEKHHLERLDYLIKPTAFLALCLHWFNPLVWAAFVLAGRDMEMSCDEAVLKKMGGDIRAEYATSLVRLTTGAGVFSVSSLAFGGNNPKQRIRNIMNYKKHGRLSAITACIICVAVAGCAVSNPNPQKKEPVDNEVLQTVIPTPSPKQTEPSGKAEPAGETDRNSYKGYVWDDEYYFINENGRVVKKADNQETGICVFFRDDYENILHMSGAVKEQFEGLFDETNLVVANRIALEDIDENGQQECAWLLSFGASRIMGPFFQLAFEWNGEIIYIHEEPAMTQTSIGDTVTCLDLDHDGAKEILLTMLPHVNSRSLTEFVVLKQCSDGSWKNLENPATHFETIGNHFTNSFPITVKKSEHPHTAMISCEGLDKTIFYDTQNYCSIWMDCDHGSGCTCGCQAKQHHNDDHHGNEKHHGNGYNTSVSSGQLTPEGKIVNYYLNEFPRLATGETCGGTCAWGIRDIRPDTCNKIPCLVATQGIEGKDQQQPWGTADIYFDYDSNGTIRILDMKFTEWIN